MKTVACVLFIVFLTGTTVLAKDSETDIVTPARGRIQMSELSHEISGSFNGGKVLTFRAIAKPNEQFDVTVDVNDATLTAAIDNSKKIANMNVTTKKAGAVHRLTIEDKQMLLGALRALELKRKLEKTKLTPAGLTLERTLNLWADWPVTMPLQKVIQANLTASPNGTSGITTLCSYARCPTASGSSYFGSCTTMVYYQYASHDCYKGGFSNAVNQQRASLGDHYRCSGDELYWNGTTWACGEPDHWNRPSVTGNCFGRCGGDCGEVSVYSVDCANHDGCVRNGHALASAYCNDQFTSASDDYMFGTPCYTSTP